MKELNFALTVVWDVSFFDKSLPGFATFESDQAFSTPVFLDALRLGFFVLGSEQPISVETLHIVLSIILKVLASVIELKFGIFEAKGNVGEKFLNF